MERRQFIQTSAAVGAIGLAGVAGASCGRLLGAKATAAPGDPLLPEMRDTLAAIDGGLALIGEWDHPRETALAQKALKALYLTGMFADLPEEGQSHPGVQARMWEAMPDMDGAVLGMADYLRGRSRDELAELQRALRARPDAPLEIADLITTNAGIAGVSGKRRLQTRAIIGQVSARMRRQPPSLLLSEYDGKVRKLAAHARSNEEIERRLALQLGGNAYDEKRRRWERLALLWGAAEGGAPVAAVAPDAEAADAGVDGGADAPAIEAPAPAVAAPAPSPAEAAAAAKEPEKKPLSERQRLMRGGGVTMGLSLLTAGVGGLVCIANPLAGAVVLTVGGVQLLVGLIVLIVGAAHDER